MRWLALQGALLSGCFIDGGYVPPCGNGQLDPQETCDDGNLVNGDGCSDNCEHEVICGDGVIDTVETCDDGNSAPGDGCSETCLIETTCGDNHVEGRELCDDGNTDPADGCSPTCVFEFRAPITVTWSFPSVASPTIDAGCPAGWDEVRIQTLPLRADGSEVGMPLTEIFDCAAKTGTLQRYAARYRMVANVGRSGTNDVYASSPPAVVDGRAYPTTYDAPFFTDGGYVAVHWSLVGATTAIPLTCEQVTDDISVSVVGPGFYAERILPCRAREGRTAVIPAGTYDVSVSALDALGASVGDASALPGVVVAGPSQVTDVGVVTIAIAGR